MFLKIQVPESSKFCVNSIFLSWGSSSKSKTALANLTEELPYSWSRAARGKSCLPNTGWEAASGWSLSRWMKVSMFPYDSYKNLKCFISYPGVCAPRSAPFSLTRLLQHSYGGVRPSALPSALWTDFSPDSKLCPLHFESAWLHSGYHLTASHYVHTQRGFLRCF